MWERWILPGVVRVTQTPFGMPSRPSTAAGADEVEFAATGEVRRG